MTQHRSTLSITVPYAATRSVEAPLWQRLASSKLGNISARKQHILSDSDLSSESSRTNICEDRESSPPAGPLIHAWRSANAVPSDAPPVGDEDEDEDDSWIAELDSLLLIDERIRSTPPPVRPSFVPSLSLPGSAGPSSPLTMSPTVIHPLPKKLAEFMQKPSTAVPERAVGCYVPAPGPSPSSAQAQGPQGWGGAHSSSSPTPPPRGVLCEHGSAAAAGKRRLSIGAAPSKRPRAEQFHPGDAAALHL
ncbi:hypothetical protein T484DRAFT_1786240 [Baffinella frigidus]|nr:hypothetical protein T484DRAFT_1786240 [Cryptophyta sp. CCMP2293]